MNKLRDLKMPVVKHGDDAGQCWNPRVSPHPIMPENCVPFYERYIPVRCAGHPEQLQAALDALAQRNQFAIEQVFNTVPFPRDE